jgi:hypothetical protein
MGDFGRTGFDDLEVPDWSGIILFIADRRRAIFDGRLGKPLDIARCSIHRACTFENCFATELMCQELKGRTFTFQGCVANIGRILMRPKCRTRRAWQGPHASGNQESQSALDTARFGGFESSQGTWETKTQQANRCACHSGTVWIQTLEKDYESAIAFVAHYQRCLGRTVFEDQRERLTGTAMSERKGTPTD